MVGTCSIVVETRVHAKFDTNTRRKGLLADLVLMKGK